MTIKSVKLLGMKKQTTIATSGSGGADVTLTATTKADGTSGDIVLFSGSATAAGTYCGVFPNQSKSGDFIAITAECRGFESTITYSLSASKNFAQNQQYNISIQVPATTTNQTVAITGWSADDTNPLTITTDLTDPAAMKTSGIENNPLYWVAEYNIATIKGVNGDATAFAQNHSTGTDENGVMVFKWEDAIKLATKTVNAADGTEAAVSDQTAKMTNYHLPTQKEQIAVLASNSNTASGTNIWGISNTGTSVNDIYEMTEAPCEIHNNANVEQTVNSVWIKAGEKEHYAVRFINTAYASVWHYKWVGNGLIIESYLLNEDPVTLDQAKRVLLSVPKSLVWTGTPNMAPGDTPPSGTSYAYRYLPACGFRSGSGAATRNVGQICAFWSCSYSGDDAFNWNVNSVAGFLLEFLHAKGYGCSVRLFRDY